MFGFQPEESSSQKEVEEVKKNEQNIVCNQCSSIILRSVLSRKVRIPITETSSMRDFVSEQEIPSGGRVTIERFLYRDSRRTLRVRRLRSSVDGELLSLSKIFPCICFSGGQ